MFLQIKNDEAIFHIQRLDLMVLWCKTHGKLQQDTSKNDTNLTNQTSLIKNN